MIFSKKIPFYIALIFLFPNANSIKIYSQDQKFSPIVYQDTVILYSPALPIIFDVNHLHLSRPLTPENPFTKPLFPPWRISEHKLFEDVNQKNTIHEEAYDYVIKNNIRQIKYTIADFTGKVKPVEKIQSNAFHLIFKVDDDSDLEKVAKPEPIHFKRRYWIYNGNHKIQLSQNYVSQNWYKGGVKNINLINRHDVAFNYQKNKFQVNNLAEWRLNLYTNPNDTIRHRGIGEDLIRTYSDFGIQAFQNWFYSSNIEIKTQLLKNYGENSEQAISSAFAPLSVNIGIWGMRYQIEKLYPQVRGKKLNFNADVSPLSIRYIAVLDKDIDPQRFGIKEGARHLTDFGSTVNAKIVFFFNKYVNFNSRFYYFTNYKSVTAESENTMNMPINRYFSTSLYLFIRYDDNSPIVKDQTLGYFQVNELLSFGFNYNW